MLFSRGRKTVAQAALLVMLLPGSALADNGIKHAPVAGPKAKTAQNVILLIGDGMQLEHEIAYSRYATGEDFGLVWNQFPSQVPATTWDVTTYNRYAALGGHPAYDPQAFDPLVGYNPALGGDERFPVEATGHFDYFFPNNSLSPVFATDSASAGTAIAAGVKTDDGNIAWLPGDPADGALETIAEMIRDQKQAAIGVVSTVPFNHATPAAFVSHNISRNNYHQIAHEIITQTMPDVVIGAGYNHTGYMSAANNAILDTSQEYIVVRRAAGIDGGVALQAGAHEAIAAGKKLFGLFGGAGGHFESPVPAHNPGNPLVSPATIENPDLAEATTAALEVLAQNPRGFFIMIEQGDIDWANHANDYQRMMGCVHDLHEAVKAAVAFVDRPGDLVDWDNTLLIVTSDHGNSYMRNLAPLGKGELASAAHIAKTGQTVTSDTKVSYSTTNHTNELVSIYALGSGSWLFEKYQGDLYPGTGIVDNTDIYKVMKEFALEGWTPGTSRAPYLFRNGTAFPSAKQP